MTSFFLKKELWHWICQQKHNKNLLSKYSLIILSPPKNLSRIRPVLTFVLQSTFAIIINGYKTV